MNKVFHKEDFKDDIREEVIKAIPQKRILKSAKQLKKERDIELERLFKYTLKIAENMEFFDEELNPINSEEIETFKNIPASEWNNNPRIIKYAEEVYVVRSLCMAEEYRRISKDQARGVYFLMVTEKELNGVENPNYCMSKEEFNLWIRIFNKLFKI